MVGYSEMREVMLWVQTNAPATVRIDYYAVDAAKTVYQTSEVMTAKEGAYTAHLLADQVMPGKRYNYTVYINDKEVSLPYPTTFQSQMLWKWRVDPPAVRFATGSCLYVNEEAFDRPGKPYGKAFQILDAIYQQKPEFMVWLGDNAYLREADWNTRTGIVHRYTHTRSFPGLQPLLANTHHYAIWDDHDYGPNDSDRGYFLKETTFDVFKLFWANPGYGLPEAEGAISHFQWADLEFFMLDNRYHRSPDLRVTGDRTMLGKEQLEWLINGLKGSYAPFKFVCIGGQVLNDAKVYETYINVMPEERQYLLDRIAEEKINGVVFLTGDRHHTELSKWQAPNGITVWDLTTSPLTSGPGNALNEANSLRVADTYVGENNFSVLEVTGPDKSRVLKINVFSADGKALWSREILPK